MQPQNPNRLFPLILTPHLEATKRFYTETLGFRTRVDHAGYLQVAYGPEEGPELCFMTPDAFPDGKVRPAFSGQGLFMSIPTPNADEKHAQLKALGVTLLSQPEDKPWGWRSFLALDPNGVVLDFFHVYKAVDMLSA